MLCSVTPNSCSVASLRERINDVSGTGATVKKSSGVVCLLCFQGICFWSSCRRNGSVQCLTTVHDSVCSPVDCLAQHEG